MQAGKGCCVLCPLCRTKDRRPILCGACASVGWQPCNGFCGTISLRSSLRAHFRCIVGSRPCRCRLSIALWPVSTPPGRSTSLPAWPPGASQTRPNRHSGGSRRLAGRVRSGSSMDEWENEVKDAMPIEESMDTPHLWSGRRRRPASQTKHAPRSGCQSQPTFLRSRFAALMRIAERLGLHNSASLLRLFSFEGLPPLLYVATAYHPALSSWLLKLVTIHRGSEAGIGRKIAARRYGTTEAGST